jgi:hypothetical protein
MALDDFFVVVGWRDERVVLADLALDLEINVVELTGLVVGLLGAESCIQGPLYRCGA